LIYIFISESWHAQRLENREPEISEASIAERNVDAIFDFGERVRNRLQRFAAETDENVALPHEFEGARQFKMSHRKTIFFLLIHETRHLAQVAMALRNGGYKPPERMTCFSARPWNSSGARILRKFYRLFETGRAQRSRMSLRGGLPRN
jgi:uncharacterized damage-inducible protein DinB